MIQRKVKYFSDRFISQMLHLILSTKKKKKKKASFGICSELDFYLVDKFSQIQGDYNAFDSKIQLILVQCNWIILRTNNLTNSENL